MAVALRLLGGIGLLVRCSAAQRLATGCNCPCSSVVVADVATDGADEFAGATEGATANALALDLVILANQHSNFHPAEVVPDGSLLAIQGTGRQSQHVPPDFAK